MKEILNNLWEKYFFEECSTINTNEEKELLKKLADLREKAYVSLNDEEKEAVERCFETLYDIETIYAKKAFFKGCEFAVSFLFELGNNNNII